jgi:spore coat protein U-like protein
LQEGPIDLPLQLYVKSTSAYRVTVSSTNQGRLRLAGTDWAIGYQLSVGSKTMDLNKVDQIQVTRSGAHDDNYHLGVDVREVANKRAGVYSDTLTFTVAAI